MADKTIPLWSLESIYPSIESKEHQEAKSNLKNGLSELASLVATKPSREDFPSWLNSYLEKYNKTISLFQSMYAYAHAIYSCDTTNTAFLNNLSQIEQALVEVQDIDFLFTKILTEHKQALPTFYTAYPQYTSYSFILNEYIEGDSHYMSREEENLANSLQRYASSAWSRLQEQIISSLVDAETGKTFNELRNEAYAQERNVRKTAFEKERALLKSSEIAIAACLNNIKGATLELNKKRSWEEPIDKALFANRLSKKSLDALISAIEDSLPFWQDYLKTKARLLGLEKCEFYDLFAPLVSENTKEKIWSFAEAQKYIIETFGQFSKSLADFAQKAFENNWIDAKVRQGKVGGAYCTDFPYHKEPRVLSNFTGTFSDILTLAHELGHAYHFDCIKDEDFSLSHYPMTLAETASIFAETVVMHDAIGRSQGFEKVKLIESSLSDSAQVLVDILSRFYFERSVFEHKKEGELSAQDFSRLMKEAQEKTYGSGLTDKKHDLMWAVKGHYYGPDLDFYNFPYAFGLLFARSLFAVHKENTANGDSSFPTTYIELLKNTGRFSCEEVCAQAGFDIQTKAFWKKGIDSFVEELAEMKAYAQSIK